MKSRLKNAKTILINTALLAFIIGAFTYEFLRITDKPVTINPAESCRHFYEFRPGEFHQNNSDWCGHGEGNQK